GGGAEGQGTRPAAHHPAQRAQEPGNRSGRSVRRLSGARRPDVVILAWGSHRLSGDGPRATVLSPAPVLPARTARTPRTGRPGRSAAPAAPSAGRQSPGPDQRTARRRPARNCGWTTAPAG